MQAQIRLIVAQTSKTHPAKCLVSMARLALEMDDPSGRIGESSSRRTYDSLSSWMSVCPRLYTDELPDELSFISPKFVQMDHPSLV